MDNNPRPDRAARLRAFAEYVTSAARKAGYDIDGPRGGGKTKLARDAGVSLSTISRLLSGERAPDPENFEGLARALGVDLRELLVRSGIFSAESMHSWPETAVRSRPITPRDAADDLGITDPVDREMFLAMVSRLKRQQLARRHEGSGGAAAEA
ncbi:helix-turn-helix domain-containing protein [Kitasatospora sp. NBC_00070]|uniref:helix-turn-helix domain-containing protein n=1 Tax=Kitasatospora sp. NBC_00070 TaxID=2975962 RepID=UPI00324E0107